MRKSRNRFELRVIPFICLVVMALPPLKLKAQTLSTYSALGIGDINYVTTTSHSGMGGLGLSNSNIYTQNLVNPSLLPDNSMYSFSGGFSAVNKFILQGANREQAGGGGLSYFSMILPVHRGIFAIGFNLAPMTNVNYGFQTVGTVEGYPQGELVVYNLGTGGFNKFAISGGLKIADRLYLGAKVGYVFSSITTERSNFLTSPLGLYVPKSETQLSANDLVYQVSMAYKIAIGDEYKLQIGAVYDIPKQLRVSRTQTFQTTNIGAIPVSVDTLQAAESGFLELPASYGAGLSVTKTNQWMLGADIRFGAWSDFVDFQGNKDLVNSTSIVVGGEIIPDATSVDNYFARIAYRGGINFEQTPYIVNGTQIDEFGINFGFSLPVSNFSTLDLGFRYGSRGTTQNNLIKENFFKIFFGFTFNDNLWFVRPKFN